VTTEREQLQRWKEYFNVILNQGLESQEPESDATETNEIVVESDPSIGTHSPMLNKIKRALQQTKNGKSPGIDNIPPEILKFDVETTAQMLKPLIQEIWQNEKLPLDCKKGLIIKVPKQRNLTECNSWRGITLLSLPSKIFSRVILNRIKNAVEQHLRKEQACFHKHCSCVDVVNTLHIILEHSNKLSSALLCYFC
jgi:hypothetical protein